MAVPACFHIYFWGYEGSTKSGKMAVRARAQPYPLLSRRGKSHIFMGFGGAMLLLLSAFSYVPTAVFFGR